MGFGEMVTMVCIGTVFLPHELFSCSFIALSSCEKCSCCCLTVNNIFRGPAHVTLASGDASPRGGYASQIWDSCVVRPSANTDFADECCKNECVQLLLSNTGISF